MRLIAFQHPSFGPRLGLRIGHELVDITELGYPATLDQLLQQGPEALAAASAAAPRAKVRLALDSIAYLPPVQNPSKAIAVGLNYADHAAESPYKDPPKYPVLFHRFVSSWVAHDVPLVRPKVSQEFDYEGELVVVIGKAGRYISKQHALEHVAGYSLFNDGSLRDYQFKSTQWMMGKNFDDTGSFGPEFVTADEMPAGAMGLQLRTRLNGQVLQDASTSQLIFRIPELIAYISSFTPIAPGDLIATGTPSGVGFARKPPIFMKAGDIVEVDIEGIGVLKNPLEMDPS